MFCIKEYIFDASLFNDNGIHSRYSPQLFIEKKKWKHKVQIMYDFYLTKDIHLRENFNFILFDCRFLTQLVDLRVYITEFTNVSMGLWLFLNAVSETNVKIFLKTLNELIDLIISVRISIITR